jgi:hypothetical protein
VGGTWSRAPDLTKPVAVEAVCVIALTVATGYLFSRGLHAGVIYDEGVYMASLDALAHGQRLGSDVFASQSPGFYALLELERVVAGSSVAAVRAAMLAMAGLLALGLVAMPIAFEDAATQVLADLPSVALSLVAVALTMSAVRTHGKGSVVTAFAAGAALAAAVSVQLVACTTIVPVAATVLGARRQKERVAAITAGVALVTAGLLVFYAPVLGALWTDSVRFHLDTQSSTVEGRPSLVGNFFKVAGAVADSQRVRSPLVWVVAAGVAGALLAWRRHRLLATRSLWLWALATAAVLVWHRPLWAHDVLILTTVLALASATGLVGLLAERGLAAKSIAVACTLLISGTLADHAHRSIAGESSGVRWAESFLRTHTSPGSEVVSDWPIIPVYANRRQPGNLIDTSRTRVDSGWLSPTDFRRAIATTRLSAVVLVGRTSLYNDALLRVLSARFRRTVATDEVPLPGATTGVIHIFFAAR